MARRLPALLLLLPAAAAAQDGVSLFGVVDVSLLHGRGSIASRTQLAPGGADAPRIGIRGGESLGAGYRAFFWFEAEIFPDSGRGGVAFANNQVPPGFASWEGASGLTFNRLAVVGVAAPWGSVRFGRDYTPTFAVHGLYDPAGAGGMLGSQSAYSSFTVGPGLPTAVRVSNSLLLGIGQPRSGPLLHAVMGLGENPSDGRPTANDGNYRGVRAAYTRSPVDVSVAWGLHKFSPAEDFREFVLGGRYEFGALHLWALHVRNRSGKGFAMRGSMLATTYGAGPWSYRATVSHGAQRNPAGTPIGTTLKAGAGATYSLSKRTSVYANAAWTRNSHGAAMLPVGGIGQTAPNQPGRGREVGLRHTF